MSRFLRISAVLALIAGLAATAAFLMPASTHTVTAETPDLGDLEEGLFTANTICDSDEIEISCMIDSDACGRSFAATGCCDRDDTASCALVPSGSPPCSAGFSITCTP